MRHWKTSGITWNEVSTGYSYPPVFLREPEKLAVGVLDIIERSGEDALVSMASLWEIAVKVSLNKLYLPKPFEEPFPHSISASGLKLLPIEAAHLVEVSRLPFHHRDPFDRLLIAQARVENLTLISVDPQFPSYGIPLF